jgi:hypothetical protein
MGTIRLLPLRVIVTSSRTRMALLSFILQEPLTLKEEKLMSEKEEPKVTVEDLEGTLGKIQEKVTMLAERFPPPEPATIKIDLYEIELDGGTIPVEDKKFQFKLAYGTTIEFFLSDEDDEDGSQFSYQSDIVDELVDALYKVKGVAEDELKYRQDAEKERRR